MKNYDKILKKLQKEKLCPSKLGLKDVLMPDCEYEFLTDCEGCRRTAIKIAKREE